MKITRFAIDGPVLIESKIFSDERGFFTERYKLNFGEELNLPNFIQDNFSRSIPNVIRGLHYQWDQPQGKLVTALRGKIYDVAVDIRKNSPTYGQYVQVLLDGNLAQWFWIPEGFAHGFCVIGNDSADVLYKVNAYYNPNCEAGIIYNDLQLNIEWPVTEPLLSSKDKKLQSFSQYSENPKFL
jgi:dTDP-4-dehydrorhamnose 3,5-epimerase